MRPPSGLAVVHPRALHERSLPPSPTTALNASESRLSMQAYTSSRLLYDVSPIEAAACDYDCALWPFDVDVCYWPAPSANTACLDTIGDDDSLLFDGSSTSLDQNGHLDRWWGCETNDPTSGKSHITTAVLSHVNSIALKISLFNPWSSQPCTADTRSSAVSDSHSTESLTSYAPIHARGHS